MAYIQHITPPPNKILSFSLRDFSGGLNNRSDQLQINEASDLINMKFADETLMEKRHGITSYNDIQLEDPITFIDEYRPYNDDDKVIVATNKELYIDGVKLCDVSGQVMGVNFKGKYFFVDGNTLRVYGKFDITENTYYKVYGIDQGEESVVERTNCGNKTFEIVNNTPDKPRKVYFTIGRNGGLFDYLGKITITGTDKNDESIVEVLEAPPDKENTNNGGTRYVVKSENYFKSITSIKQSEWSLVGIYSHYGVDTIRFGYGESEDVYDYNDEYVLFTVLSPPKEYTPLPTSHKQGVTWVDFGDKNVWYEECQNELEDEYKGKNAIPDKPKYLVARKGRLFMSGIEEDNDNVFISDVDNPYYFPPGLPLQLSPNSDLIVGMAVYDDSVVVGRHDDIYVIQGETNNPQLGFSTFVLKKLNTHTGFASQRAITLAHNYFFFLGNDGNFYSLGTVSGSDTVLATVLLNKSIDIEKKPIDLTLSDCANAVGYFYKDQWFVSFGDKVLIYSYRHKAWTMYNHMYATSFYQIDDVFFWGTSDGKLSKIGESFYDYGEPFQAFWQSKYFDMDDANVYKYFREFFLVAHTYLDYYSDINITFDVDYAEISNRHVVKNMISVFGRAKWGERFISRNIVDSLPFIIGARGRSIRFKCSNGYEKTGTVELYSDLDNVPEKKDYIMMYVTDESNYYLYYDREWILMEEVDLNQGMKIYQINGDYEIRGKR